MKKRKTTKEKPTTTTTMRDDWFDRPSFEGDDIKNPFIYKEETNPKDLIGAKKVSLTKLPAIGVLHGAHAMMNGADKYGPYNWREKHVQAGIYIDAAMRHLQAWFEREETSDDANVHHLGHVIACCAILLDAQSIGMLVDDRPFSGQYAYELKQINAKIKEKSDAKS